MNTCVRVALLPAIFTLGIVGCARRPRIERNSALLADSLGIDGVARVLSVGDSVLSFDMTKAQLQRHVPGLKRLARSWDHETWHRPPSATIPMELMVSFHFDSGTFLERVWSPDARPAAFCFDAIDVSQERVAALLERLQPVIKNLGPPSNCTRDTSVARRARGAPKDRAIWRRNGAEVYWAIGGLPESPDDIRAGRLRIASLQIYRFRPRCDRERPIRSLRHAHRHRLFSDQIALLTALCRRSHTPTPPQRQHPRRSEERRGRWIYTGN